MYFISKFTCNKPIRTTYDITRNTQWNTYHVDTNGNKTYACQVVTYVGKTERLFQVYRDNIMLEITMTSNSFTKYLRLTKDDLRNTSHMYYTIITFKHENGNTSTGLSEKLTSKISSDVVKKFLKQN